MRRSLRWRIAISIAAVVLWCGILALGYMRRPLSRDESRIVGQWTSGTGPTHIFRADRSFTTTCESFEGRWSVADDKLTVEYWAPPVRLAKYYDVFAILRELRMNTNEDRVTWKVEFADDESPINKGEWKRRTTMSP